MQDDSNSELVSELAKEFLKRCRKGQRPALSEYIEQHPELEEQIREVFPMMLLMEDVAPEDTSKPNPCEFDLERLGDFVIHRVIGRGGMGIVYEATQESLGRRVALKVCPLSAHMSSRNRERFRRESRAAAMLHHTNIVPVFAVGEEDSMLYYAMQYIRGATLDDVIQELHLLWRSAPTATTRLTGGVVDRSDLGGTIPSVMASEVAQSLVRNRVDSGQGESMELATGGSSDNLAAGASQATRAGDTGHATDSVQSKSASGQTPSASAFRESENVTDVNLPGQSSDDSNGKATAKYWESVARIGIQVADALAYAHSKGTMHRDIKPGNLMLDQAGTVWVMDFGLAKSLDEDDLTQAGELIGTLRYMAPEQCRGNPETASDIYSLGLTLYELLALRPAYDEIHRSELLRAIAEVDPVSPRKINANVPRDLETIVMKAIERQPARRYAGAQELASDLNRFLDGEPIHARPVSATERVGKWIRRRPMVATLLTTLASLFVVSFLLISWKWLDAEYQKARANELLGLAEQRLGDSQVALYRSGISRAEAMSTVYPEQARTQLAGLVPKTGEVDRRGWEWGYLNGLVHQEVALLQCGAPETEWIWALAFSHDERLLAVGSGRTGFVLPRDRSPQGRVTIWDTRTAELVCELPIEHSCYALAFSHDSRRLAVSEPKTIGLLEYTWSGPARIWDLASRKPVVELQLSEIKNANRYKSFRFSADGQTLYGVNWRGFQWMTTKAWDAHTGKLKWKLPNIELIDLDERSGTFVGARHRRSDASGVQQVNLLSRFDLDSLEELEIISSGESAVMYLPRLQGAVGTTSNHQWTLQHLNTDSPRTMFGDDQHKVSTVYYARPVCSTHPTDNVLAVGNADGTVRIWRTDTGELTRVLRGHGDNVQSVIYSPSGRLLASGDWAGEVRIWQPDVLAHSVNCRPRSALSKNCAIEDIAFRADGSNLVGCIDMGAYRKKRIGVVAVWDTESGLLLSDSERSLPPIQDGLRQAKFDNQGTRLASIASDNTVRVADFEANLELFESAPFSNGVREVTLAGGGRRVAASLAPVKSATAPAVPGILVWDVDVGESIAEIRGLTRRIALNESGSILAFGLVDEGDQEVYVQIRDMDSGENTTLTHESFSIERGTRLSALAFSTDGTRLAICSEDGRLSIVDTRTGRVLTPSFSVPSGIEDLAWHPSDTRLAGANRETVVLWDAAGKEMLRLASPPRAGDWPFDPAVAFSPDGTKLAATQWNNSAKIWTAERSYGASPKRTKESYRRMTRQEFAQSTIEKTVETFPNNAWYLAARGQLGGKRRPHSQTQSDYRQAKTMLAGDDSCLLIHGEAYVQVPSLPLHASHQEHAGHTVEAWVKDWNSMYLPGESYGVIAAQNPKSGHGMDHRMFSLTKLPNRWTHVAVTFSPDGRYYFVDGKYSGRVSNKITFQDDMGDFYIADTALHNSTFKGRGLIRALRVSYGVRYHEQGGFVPEEELAPDESTMLLFDFTKDDGINTDDPRHIVDRSGNQHHGVLHKAWWLN